MRLRLGMFDAMGSRSFAVPDRASEARGIQLIADPNGAAVDYASEPIRVNSCEVIRETIQNAIHLSRYTTRN